MSITPGSDRATNENHPTDAEVQVGVRAELDLVRDLDATGIDVAVEHRIVHLDGEVRDRGQDADARSAAVRVVGVFGLVDRLHPPVPAS
jgi:osmotically-inducible protein OsmY